MNNVYILTSTLGNGKVAMDVVMEQVTVMVSDPELVRAMACSIGEEPAGINKKVAFLQSRNRNEKQVVC